MASNSLSDRVVKVTIENFLSFKHAEVRLGKLNVLIGPNASGKSNFTKALRLLGNHARLGYPALPDYRGFEDVAFGFNPYSKVRIGIEAVLGGADVRYELTLTRDDYFERAFINDKLALYGKGKDARTSVLVKEDGQQRLADVLKPYLATTTHKKLKPLLYEPKFASVLMDLPPNSVGGLVRLSSFLKSVSAHSFSPEAIRARTRVKEVPVLDYRGRNLARILLHLRLEERGAFSRVESVLKSLVPEVEEVIPHLEGEYVEVWLRVKGLGKPLKPPNISDGTLRILAFITALYSGTSLAVLEEPENCVHPHLLESLVSLMRGAPCQVIVTTHSPYLLDHVKPEEVLVVEKEGTETKVKGLTGMSELRAVKEFLEEGGTLGEAWYSGLVGGTPEA